MQLFNQTVRKFTVIMNGLSSFVYTLLSRLTIRRLVLLSISVLFLLYLPTLLYLMSTTAGFHDREQFNAAIDLSESSVNRTHTVPKIVHQIWLGGGRPPPRFLKCGETWKVLTKTRGYVYHLWNDTSLTAFFRQRHKYFLSRWLHLRYTMNRVDTAKYFLLYSFGGLYIDMDVCNIPKDPIDLLTSRKYLNAVPGRQIILQEALPSGANPEIMMAPPHHPFFRHCLRSLYDSDRVFVLPYLYMMCVGGPIFLTRAVSSYAERQRHIYMLPYVKSRDSTIFSSVRGGQWYTWDTKVIITWIYFGIFHGEILPYWLSLLILVALVICIITCVRRRIRDRSEMKST